MNTRFPILAAALLWLAAPTTSITAADAQRTASLVAVLKSDASVFEKARACQQLGDIGTADAVPALAALLPDERLGVYARTGLEGISGHRSAEALRAALSSVKGAQLRGVIDSIGALRDTNAVPALCQIASNPTSGALGNSLLALGRISSSEAAAFLLKTLSTHPAEAAAGCLLAAEQQMQLGNTDIARTLYDKVRSANVPDSLRIAAVRGSILSRKSDAVPFLVAQLELADAPAQLAAFTTIREIPTDTLAEALNALVAKAGPELQCRLLTTLIDCHNPASLQLLREKASADNPSIRETALAALGLIGGESEARTLLAAIAAKKSPSEVSIATAGLRRMKIASLDSLIVADLAAAKDADTKVKLMRLLESREASGAAPELLRQAASHDANTAITALGVLSSLAGSSDITPMISLIESENNQPIRAAAEAAIASICERVGDPGADSVLSKFQQTSNTVNKLTWMRVLSAVGYAKALPEIKTILEGSDPGLADATAEQLGKWPDPTPIDDLLAFSDKTANAALRARVRASAIQLAANAADEHQRPEPVVVAWLQRAGRSAEPQDLRQIISVLGRIKQPDSFRALQPYLENPALKVDATRAMIQIAPALVKTDIAPTLKQELLKVPADLAPDLAATAKKIATQIP